MVREMNQKNEVMPQLLLVDDDPLIADSLGFVLAKYFEVFNAESRQQAKRVLVENHITPDIALIDLGLPPTPHRPDEGFRLIEDLIAYDNTIKILVLSGQNVSANIEYARTLGAVDFIAKPINPVSLKERLFQQVKLKALEHQKQSLGTQVKLVGESQAIDRVRKQIDQFSKVQFPVLIEGESGTGKEIIAKAIHEASDRARGQFVSINCAALPPALLESQLFGHKKGAFTDAVENRIGFFEEANDGSLFLDEIGEIPLEIQAKLLRVLEDGEYYSLGHSKPKYTSARIIAATNKTLSQQVKKQLFREDLYHRLSILTIQSPPLSERGNDRFLLLDYYKQYFEESISEFSFDKDANKMWGDYEFPGNVRELRNIVIRLGTKYPNQQIDKTILREELQSDVSATAVKTDDVLGGEESLKNVIQNGKLYLDDLLAGVEKRCIQIALEVNQNNLSGAARDLHINRSTLHSRMQRHFPQGEV